MTQRLASFTFSLVTIAGALALPGCGTPTTVVIGNDAGPPDGSWMPPDATYQPPDSCDMDHLHMLEGVAGGTVGIDFDTTMTTTRPRDLGFNCGNSAADIRWANQEVVAFHVPGTGLQGVQFSSNNAQTTMNFNTLIQVRQGDCRAVPTATFPPNCFDDTSAANLTSTGGITVMGGTTLYFIVTGFSAPPAGQMAVDEGNVHVDFTVHPNSAPMLTAGSALFTGADTLITATATDAEGPLLGYTVSLYNAMGGLDTNGDGTFNDADALVLPFDTLDSAAPMYTGHSHLSGTMPAADGRVYQIAAVCRQAGVLCTQFGLRVFDQQYGMSTELRVDVHEAAIVGVGATCDIMHLCADGLMCSSGTCSAVAAAATECTGAMPFVIATPTTAATVASNHGTIAAGTGVFSASCAPTEGKENIWQITIPTGDYDLALTTDTAGTGTAVDTVLSLRSTCLDQTTELAMGCNDDISTSGGNYRSHLTFRDIPPGDYFIFVELYSGSAASPYAVQATLTPVLASGTACDPAMTNYRCATGTCGATSHMCP